MFLDASITMRIYVIFITVLALNGLSDAVMVKNEAAKLYPSFIFGLHIPLILLFISIVYIVSYYKETKSRKIAPPEPEREPRRTELEVSASQHSLQGQVPVRVLTKAAPVIGPSAPIPSRRVPAVLPRQAQATHDPDTKAHVPQWGAPALFLKRINAAPVPEPFTPVRRQPVPAVTPIYAQVAPVHDLPPHIRVQPIQAHTGQVPGPSTTVQALVRKQAKPAPVPGSPLVRAQPVPGMLPVRQAPIPNTSVPSPALCSIQARAAPIQGPPPPRVPGRSPPRHVNRPSTPWTTKSVKVPSYWHTNPEFVDLTDDESEEIKILVYSLWDPDQAAPSIHIPPNHKFIHIRRVQRVQHKALYKKYLEFKAEMERKENYIDYFKDLEDIKDQRPVQTTAFIKSTPKLNNSYLEQGVEHRYNEHYLFHGTEVKTYESVCRQGLSTYYAGGGLFGKGVYTAENPTKSDQYTDQVLTDKKLLLVRVCLGEIFVLRHKSGTYKIKAPPCRYCFKLECTCSHTQPKVTFDSIVTDVPGWYREFVVYRDHRTYPEYIITYDRVPDDTEMRKFKPRY